MPTLTELESLFEKHFRDLHLHSEKMIAEVDRHRGDCADIARAMAFDAKILGKLTDTAETLTEQAGLAADAWRQSEQIGKAAGTAAGQAATLAAREAVSQMVMEIRGASAVANMAAGKLDAVASRLRRWAVAALVLGLCAALACVYVGYRLGKLSLHEARTEELVAKGHELEQRQAAEAEAAQRRPQKKKPK